MTATIGNPLSWGIRILGQAGGGVAATTRAIGGEAGAEPQVRTIGTADIRAALRAGLDDFSAFRTDVAVMCLLYPVIGAVLAYVALHQNLIHLIFPLASGFALLGPAFAVGLYEMSRQREAGRPAGWADAFGVLRSPSFGAMVVLGLGLIAVFTLWMIVAGGIYRLTMGALPPASVGGFIQDVLTTRAGWALILLGIPAGFLFAVVVLAVSIVSFPLLLDRHVGLPLAVVTSVRVARRNPRTVALWGLIVAVALALGTIPLFLGLAVVLPILGHATWHLYRRAVA